MPINSLELANFIRQIHVFRGLDDQQVTTLAGELVEKSVNTGATLIKEGSNADYFYLIYSGSVQVTRNRPQGSVTRLVSHDYFGETAILANRKQDATVSTLEPTVVLRLSKELLRQLIKQAPGLRPNFGMVISSHNLANRLNFNWLRENEVIYFLATKHTFMLAQSLFLPVLSLFIPLLTLVGFLLIPNLASLLWATGIIFIGILAWMVWRTIDWGNDYYIVTNQRVVYLEKVIGLYDSRQEAPLSTILSVGVETDLWGRQMGFGNVIIRTFVGKIVFNNVSNPNQAAAVVEEHWSRSRETSRQAETEAMRIEMRKRFGLDPADATVENITVPAVKNETSFKKRFWSDLFKVRIEKGAIITYRKHWFVLFLQTWKPALLMVGMFLLLAVELIHAGKPIRTIFSSLPVETLFGLWVVICISLLLWWIYQYIDWSNDIFQLTTDQILDIDRKPFGTEERKAAPLENILSTDAKREGFWEYFLNYGTVYITVGGSQMRFTDVTDPVTVQQDIDNRRLARINAKTEGQSKDERERLAEWFAIYHNVSDEMNKESKEKEPGKTG